MHNYESVAFMYKDLGNVQAVAVNDEADALRLAHADSTIRLGCYSVDLFNPDIFDKEFYRHAGMMFEDRWDKFKIPEIKRTRLNDAPFFIHQDEDREFLIAACLIDPAPWYLPRKNIPFFDHLQFLIDAPQVHVFNSSFLILADSLPEVDGQKLFFHKYSRPTPHPTLKKQWHIYD